MNNSPLVSISCITYNHASYIRECMDGFLMQECDFDFEVLIHDDASTDGTQEIIKEYQEKYPEIIKPIFQKENQYSKGVRGIMAKFNFPRAQGKYIALCEGDDYWTDPLKLKRQVDFLEENPQYSLVAGGFKSINTISGEQLIDVKSSSITSADGFDIRLDMLFENIWYTKTLTLVFRKDFLNLSILKNFKHSRDFHLNYLLLKKGNGFYFKEVLGVYHMHGGGIHSLVDLNQKLLTQYNIAKELFEFDPKLELFRIRYLNVMKSVYVLNILPNKNQELIKNIFSVSRTPLEFIKGLYLLLLKVLKN